eukprot:6623904-Lingulodinium_polyedra.AAC.1
MPCTSMKWSNAAASASRSHWSSRAPGGSEPVDPTRQQPSPRSEGVEEPETHDVRRGPAPALR